MSDSFEVTVLGAGDTFSERHHPTALLLSCGGFHLGIDCPDMYRRVLADAARRCGRALSLSDIDHVLITHVHGDHMNGLEGVAFFKHFAERKRLHLVASPEVRADIWQHRLQAPMEALWDGQQFLRLGFDDYFQFTPLDWAGATRIGPFSIRTFRTQHHVPTSAVLVEAAGRTLGYSSDTAFDPRLIDFLAQADLIIHETNLGPAHTALSDLLTLPPSIRSRMHLIHYPDQLDLTSCAIPPAREGQLFQV